MLVSTLWRLLAMVRGADAANAVFMFLDEVPRQCRRLRLHPRSGGSRPIDNLPC